MRRVKRSEPERDAPVIQWSTYCVERETRNESPKYQKTRAPARGGYTRVASTMYIGSFVPGPRAETSKARGAESPSVNVTSVPR